MSGFMESPGVLGKGCLSTGEGGCLLELGRGSRCEAGGYLRLFRLEKGSLGTEFRRGEVPLVVGSLTH